jgi:hypothetical protein
MSASRECLGSLDLIREDFRDAPLLADKGRGLCEPGRSEGSGIIIQAFEHASDGSAWITYGA